MRTETAGAGKTREGKGIERKRAQGVKKEGNYRDDVRVFRIRIATELLAEVYALLWEVVHVKA